MAIPLYGKTQWAAYCCNLRDAHIAEFGKPHTEVTEAKGDIGIIGIKFGKESGALGIRREEFDGGLKVERLSLLLCFSLLPAVVE